LNPKQFLIETDFGLDLRSDKVGPLDKNESPGERYPCFQVGVLRLFHIPQLGTEKGGLKQLDADDDEQKNGSQRLPLKRKPRPIFMPRVS